MAENILAVLPISPLVKISFVSPKVLKNYVSNPKCFFFQQKVVSATHIKSLAKKWSEELSCKRRCPIRQSVGTSWIARVAHYAALSQNLHALEDFLSITSVTSHYCFNKLANR
ncbi:hypothetical protein KIN20_032382 [Parelaphostrongylus tenuis]|uniref:Uncharacterized protein n=1 Tax=Parelaphostrongylus tenuis TaxID=148309 RepID=A0AAD5R6T9_PARTN|nr:hypothetical protein KIN20_032382 [Parelaphostrongylus tenuis]